MSTIESGLIGAAIGAIIGSITGIFVYRKITKKKNDLYLEDQISKAYNEAMREVENAYADIYKKVDEALESDQNNEVLEYEPSPEDLTKYDVLIRQDISPSSTCFDEISVDYNAAYRSTINADKVSKTVEVADNHVSDIEDVTPEQFERLITNGFTRVQLTYFEGDSTLVKDGEGDEEDRILTPKEIEESVGNDFVHKFDKYQEDVATIVNYEQQKAYEITYDVRCSSTLRQP